MSLLSKAKIAYLPSSEGSQLILDFPNPRTSKSQNLLLHNDQLYELLQVSSSNPHLSSQFQPPTTKKDSKPVRSLILENLTDSTEGLILEDSEFIISSAYGLEFSLIWWFKHDNTKKFGRFQTQDDLIDMIERDIPNITKLPLALVADGLKNICETINENGEEFYKYSDTKLLDYLKGKVTKISQNFPETILDKLVKPSLFPIDITKTIPDDILVLSKLHHSIDLLSSYLLPLLQSELVKQYDFTDLDNYINKLKEDRIKRKLAEDSINELNTQNKRKPTTNNGPAKKKQAVVKKPVKLQKGTLDSFFNKKK